MIKVELTADEINILFQSIKNCLNTCHEGGPSSSCPDCQKLESVMLKLQAEVGKA